jgi:hypothetical protein
LVPRGGEFVVNRAVSGILQTLHQQLLLRRRVFSREVAHDKAMKSSGIDNGHNE